MERAFRAAHAINRFMCLPDADRWLIAEAGFYLLYAKIATFTTSTRTLLALGHLDAAVPSSRQRLTLPGQTAPTVEDTVNLAVSAIEKSSQRLPFANCLIRAVALRLLLAQRAIPTELHIGARKDERGEFAAHAWLTFGDTILVGGDDARDLYRELVRSSHSLLQ